MKIRYSLLIVVCFLMAACGPNAEQRAESTSTSLTATAAAWTATNTSTPTNTPTPTRLSTKTATLTNTPDPNRYYAPDNSYSLVAPEGWESANVGLDYPGLLGPKVDGFTLTLAFIRDNSDFDVFFYAALVQGDLEERLQNLVSVSELFLTTNDGKDYFRWEVTDTQNGKNLRQIFYFYEAGSQKLVATYSRPVNSGAEYDTLVDDAMMSIKFTP